MDIVRGKLGVRFVVYRSLPPEPNYPYVQGSYTRKNGSRRILGILSIYTAFHLLSRNHRGD